MRLKQYIKENQDFSDDKKIINIVNTLIDKCSPFLKELSKNKFKNFMYSGRKSNIDMAIKKVRVDRRPVDTSDISHKKLDDAFNKKFGWKARSNAVFCTGFKSLTSYYGTPYLIFPVGDFKFIWSPKIGDLYTDEFKYLDNKIQKNRIIDMNYEFISLEIRRRLKNNPDSNEEQIKKEVENEFVRDSKKFYNKKLQDIVNTYTDKNLIEALKSHNEIMVNCKEYIMVHNIYDQIIYDHFNRFGIKKKMNQETLSLIRKDN